YRRGQVGVKPLNITILSGGPEMDLRKATRFKRMIFRLLLIIPLVIPSDWTQDIPEKYSERHHGLTHSNYYPVMQSSPDSETP
ncbi:MAG: hypothetical protein R3312_03335, partial [Gammaproteobacteria bacterium]|nr:hypothetical protein [Gammaproteobacteria bacterium]